MVLGLDRDGYEIPSSQKAARITLIFLLTAQRFQGKMCP